jgi:hypothetical protein
VSPWLVEPGGVESGGKIPGVGSVGVPADFWGVDPAWLEQGLAVEGGFSQFSVELSDTVLVLAGDGAAEVELSASLEVERGQHECLGEAFRDDKQAVEGGIFECGLFFEHADAFAEGEGVGIAWGDGDEFLLELFAAEAEVLKGDGVTGDTEEVEGQQAGEAAHPEAVGELLAVAGCEVTGEQVDRGLTTGDAPGGFVGDGLGVGGGLNGEAFAGQGSEGGFPRGVEGRRGDEAPWGWVLEPALHFAGPQQAGQLLDESRGSVGGEGCVEQVERFELTVLPPGGEAECLIGVGFEVEEGAVRGRGRADRLVEEWDVELIHGVAGLFEFLEIALERGDWGDDEHDRLEVGGGLRHDLEGPGDLSDWQWGDLLELEFEHGWQLLRGTGGQAEDAEGRSFDSSGGRAP